MGRGNMAAKADEVHSAAQQHVAQANEYGEYVASGISTSWNSLFEPRVLPDCLSQQGQADQAVVSAIQQGYAAPPAPLRPAAAAAKTDDPESNLLAKRAEQFVNDTATGFHSLFEPRQLPACLTQQAQVDLAVVSVTANQQGFAAPQQPLRPAAESVTSI